MPVDGTKYIFVMHQILLSLTFINRRDDCGQRGRQGHDNICECEVQKHDNKLSIAHKMMFSQKPTISQLLEIIEFSP
jgi:hypothetical protein